MPASIFKTLSLGIILPPIVTEHLFMLNNYKHLLASVAVSNNRCYRANGHHSAAFTGAVLLTYKV